MAQDDTLSDSLSLTLDQLIDLCIEKEASDIHFGEGNRAALRIHGKLAFLDNIAPITKEQAEQMIFGMLTDPREQDRLKRIRELDFAYTHTNGVTFRVNVFYRMNRIATVMRMIPKRTPTLEELGIPQGFERLLELGQGLILVTGTAGSGKSTSIQAMLHHLNEHYVKHILTIENPIEYLFENKNCFFSQREVGKDTLSFVNGLNAALHEDANVVVVSDLRSMEVVDAALEIVETGHLVIASISTSNAPQTINRLVSLFPPNQQEQVRNRLADHLRCVLSQTLVPRADARGRIGVFELLLPNESIKNMIRRGDLRQLHVAMASAFDEGLITLEGYAYKLAENGLITQETLAQFASDE